METTETLDPNIETAKLIQQLGSVDGHFESPINLNITFMKVIELNPLKWVNIDVTPRKLKVTNTGFTVFLSATWQIGRAYISGGPLLDNYLLSQIHFHWGENAMNGSEHRIDGARMPMELHVVFFKDEYENFDVALRKLDGVIIVVYFFKLQNEPNEFIRDILRHASEIRTADSSVRMLPEKLTTLVKPFSDDYFLYWGSIVIRNNPYRILWIISREPIGVSVEQIATFRTLTNDKGMPILSNVREVQERDERTVFHVCPSGSTYASLLPLPWNFSQRADQPNQSTTDSTL
ncbi:carbonic anhydrase 1 [Lasioglossum baleicum]|uniref:carbonic anhydrase 1 n=1 Tax=Lasioglossum baleicum TaxID=434251 RepID=UPI003FCC34FE